MQNAEPMLATLGRRAVTLPLYFLLLATVLTLLPVLAPIALVVDLVRRKQLATSRCLAFFAVYLACEVAGISASFALWLVSPLLGGLASERSRTLHYALQGWWANALYRGTEILYGLSRDLEEEGEIGRGPLLVFARHASIGDTVIPAVYLSGRHGLRLRYVLKRELLWDPCVDLVGNRLPNYFVRRGSGDMAQEAQGVAQLVEGLGPHEGVLIYPEGTRFTTAKRDRLLERLAKGGDAHLLARARRLRRVLPPRLGGSLALLEANPGADVVFCAHVGFDAAATFWHFWNGSLIGQTIRVRFWRVSAVDIPKDPDARIDWLFDQWERVDAYVCEKYPAGGED